MKKIIFSAVALLFVSATPAASAADTVVQMHLVNKNGVGESVGTVDIMESDYGLIFRPKMTGLTSGMHGFHVHVNPSCEAKEKGGKTVPALAAGGHYDPNKTKHHDLPWADGHLGDLPSLYVDTKGNAGHAVLAPRIKKLSEIKGRALMVHAGGDNYSDHPKKLGGGGARMACGVIQ